jgi:hypothetical protein
MKINKFDLIWTKQYILGKEITNNIKVHPWKMTIIKD